MESFYFIFLDFFVRFSLLLNYCEDNCPYRGEGKKNILNPAEKKSNKSTWIINVSSHLTQHCIIYDGDKLKQFTDYVYAFVTLNFSQNGSKYQ